MSSDPPNVPTSPQVATPGAFPDAGVAPIVLHGDVGITADQIQGVTINREKLSDWHHKIRSKLFPLVGGFFVRCRVEDSTEGKALYKVARIKSLKPDWSVELDLLTTDEIKLGRNNTNYDCISNAKLSPLEISTWVTKLAPDALQSALTTIFKMEERLRLLETLILTEPAFAGKKKEEKEG